MLLANWFDSLAPTSIDNTSLAIAENWTWQCQLNCCLTLCNKLRNNYNTEQSDFIMRNKGKLTVLVFSENEMAQLRKDYGIYCVGYGRINIADLTETHILYVAAAIIKISQL